MNILNSFLKYDLSGLVTLNSDNFDKIVNGKRSVIVMFYKKDCATCDEVLKEYISFFTIVRLTVMHDGDLIITRRLRSGAFWARCSLV